MSGTTPPTSTRQRRVTHWTVDVGKIERARVLRGWTIIELSRVAHIDRGTFSDLVQGQHRPTLGTVQAIATALGLTLSDVIEFADE